MRTVKTFSHADGKERVSIVERNDGIFVIDAYRWWEEVMDDGTLLWRGWNPIGGCVSLFASAELAEQEARVRFPWIST